MRGGKERKKKKGGGGGPFQTFSLCRQQGEGAGGKGGSEGVVLERRLVFPQI